MTFLFFNVFLWMYITDFFSSSFPKSSSIFIVYCLHNVFFFILIYRNVINSLFVPFYQRFLFELVHFMAASKIVFLSFSNLLCVQPFTVHVSNSFTSLSYAKHQQTTHISRHLPFLEHLYPLSVPFPVCLCVRSSMLSAVLRFTCFFPSSLRLSPSVTNTRTRHRRVGTFAAGGGVVTGTPARRCRRSGEEG